ncbi:histone-lysine N-methyltransferase PRDM9, partial [Caerostris extrusa]
LPGESHKRATQNATSNESATKEEEVPDQEPISALRRFTARRIGVCQCTVLCSSVHYKGRERDSGCGRDTCPWSRGGVRPTREGGQEGWSRVKESDYAWQVRRRKAIPHVEGVDEGSSTGCGTWCADSEEWQNVVAFQYKGAIYRTYKPVLPYTEILVWCGNEYSSHLGIDVRQKKNLPLPKEITGFQCEACDALFSSQDALQRHRKMHPRQGLKRHRCPECSYSTDNTGNLRVHLLTHSGEKPHTCDQCHKRFSKRTISARTSSCTRAKRGTSAAPAEKRFAREFDLRRHEGVQSGERPYRCSDCGKDFSQAIHLKRHQGCTHDRSPTRVRTAEYRSTESDALKMHVASVHTGVFPHNCDLCGKGFHRPGRLRSTCRKEAPGDTRLG